MSGLDETQLALAQEQGMLPADKALELLLTVQALKDLTKRAEDNLKEQVRRGLQIIDPTTQKLWKLTTNRGRETVNLPLLRKELGTHAARYVTRGEDYDLMRWTKVTT
jgi:hypothetical protein